jgi:hypothetical protein
MILSNDLGMDLATLLCSKPVTTNTGSKRESIKVLETILINASPLYGNNNLLTLSILSEEPAARIVAEIFKLDS